MYLDNRCFLFRQPLLHTSIKIVLLPIYLCRSNKYKYCSVVFFGRYQTAENSNFPMLCPLDNVKTFPTLTRP